MLKDAVRRKDELPSAKNKYKNPAMKKRLLASMSNSPEISFQASEAAEGGATNKK